MKRVVVTGAHGFLGQALCRELVSKGIKVYALVHSGEHKISGTTTIVCDMSEYQYLEEKIPSDFDTIFHFAWTGSAGSLRGDYEVQLNNIRYTCDLIKSCYEKKCRRFIFASSIMVYEVTKNVENNIKNGINTIYSSSKLAADYMLNALTASKYKMDYIRGVISNVYGPGETSSRLINSSIRKMLNGVHCSFSSGEQMYDFIYIDDAVKAFLAIAEKGLSHKTYYIGSEKPKPLKEFLLEMRDAINPSIKLGLGDLPFDGISLNYNEFDIHSVKDDTGFIPKYSFGEGVKETIKWILETDNFKNGWE